MADKYTLPEFAVSRIRYYDGLFLSDSDFIEEQSYHIGAQRRHEGLLHTAGITEGLDVSITNAGASVEISAGSALDSEGRQVLLSEAKTIYVDQLWGNGARFLEMTFQEAETGIADQSSTVSAATRFTHSPSLALNETQTEGAVLIAVISINGGLAASIDTTSRVYSGLRLPVPTGGSPIELTSSNDGTTAELSSKLRVAGATALDNSLAVTGETSLSSSLAVAGATALGSTLGVTGSASLANTLAVTGATTLANTLTVAGATAVNNTLGVTGNTTLASASGSTVTVAGATSINNTLGVTGNTSLATGSGSTLTVAGATSINNTLGVTGSTSLATGSGSTLNVVGAATLSNTLGVVGNTTLTGTLTANNAVKVNSTLEATGNTTLASGSGSTLTVSGAAKINNALDVTGSTTLATTSNAILTVGGAAKINNTLEVTGTTALASGLSSTLSVGGATTISNALTTTGDTTLATGSGKTLTVTGAATINNDLTATGNITLASGTSKTLTVTGAATVNNNLTVTGNTTLASGTSKTLTVTGATTVNNDLTATGNITLASGTSKTLTVTGAATVNNDFTATGNITLASGTSKTLTVTGTATINNDLTATGNITLASGTSKTLTVTGAATVNNNLTVTGNTTLASGTSKTLTVTGATTINNDLTATGNIVLASGGSKTLSVTGAASLSSTLSVTGNTTLATGSGSTLTVTGASTFSSDMTVSCGGGTNVRTLTFDNAATARILFKSSSNALNDWGYILFQNDSTFLNSIFDSSDSSAENARLSIGVRNDYANLAGSKPADAVDIQGSAQLTLNAGKWDTELDSLIGSQWSESGMGSTNGISFRIDNTERMRLNGTALTVGTDMTLSGARTLKFDNTTQSQILWTSANNYGSDSAFIVYLADSSQHGTNSENGRLSIGVYNDFGSTNADALDVQGGYKLKLNAGKWDSELNTVIGSTGIDSTNYGISLCVNDSEKMKIDSSGITVPSSVYVKGLSVVELKSGSHSFSSTGPWQSTAITVTFSRELWSAVPMVQGWYFAYNTRMYLKKAGAWIESVTVTGSSCNFTLRAMWEDDNYDDDWTATVYYAVVGVLKYTV